MSRRSCSLHSHRLEIISATGYNRSTETKSIVILIALIVLALVLWLWLGNFMMRRATEQVIKIFRAQQAVDHGSAKTAQELGLAPKPLFSSFFSRRDWKPRALQMLVSAGIVQTMPDGRLYLDESVLQNSIFARRR